LNWFDSGKVEIKREMDSAAGQIRVMTVHAAKGLEAPIVILPDTVGVRQSDKSEIIPLNDKTMAWKAGQGDRSKVEQQAIETRQELALKEKLRLLYVALTRAESWLVVCGAGKLGKESALNWYQVVATGMQNVDAVETASGLVLQNKFWPNVPVKPDAMPTVQKTKLPDWIAKHAPATNAPIKTLSPSNLDDRKALVSETDGTDGEAAKRRGILIHLLLEHLPNHPEVSWDAFAHAIIQRFDNAAHADEIADALDVARAIITHPKLLHIFGPESLAEVKITAVVPELDARRIYGAIDRLVVKDNKVLAVDFKSNKTVPLTQNEVPIGLLRQMGAYLSALKSVYPNHEIEVAILWTENQQLMSLNHDIVIEALKATTTS
jgi:ATP-dependent helicase/nuclease subunit A